MIKNLEASKDRINYEVINDNFDNRVDKIA